MIFSPLYDIAPVLATADCVVWRDIAPRDGRPGFVPSEFNRPYAMDAQFLYWLWRTRQDCPVPFRVISDARDPDDGIGASRSAHNERPCRAVDLQAANSYERACILIAAIKHGCVRFGVYPGNDNDGGGLHLDCSVANPSPRCWTRW